MNTIVWLACVVFQGEPAGTPEQLMLYKLAHRYNQPSQVDAPLESMGLASSNFATRYCAVLVQLHRCVESGRGYETAYQGLLRLSGAGGPVVTVASRNSTRTLRFAYRTRPLHAKWQATQCRGANSRSGTGVAQTCWASGHRPRSRQPVGMFNALGISPDRANRPRRDTPGSGTGTAESSARV